MSGAGIEIEREIVAKIRAVGRRSATVGQHRSARRAALCALRRTTTESILVAGNTGDSTPPYKSSRSPRAPAWPERPGRGTEQGPATADLMPSRSLITQHMPPVFTGLLAQRLTARLPVGTCVEAVDEMPVRARTHRTSHPETGIWWSHTGMRGHPVILRLTADAAREPLSTGGRRDVAVGGRGVWQYATLAVVLTGMGEDGRRGCAAVIHANAAGA